MNRNLFLDYGELLFAYRFNPATLSRAHQLMLPQLGRDFRLEDLSTAHNQAIQTYLRARKSGQEWTMERIMRLFLVNLGVRDESLVEKAVNNYKLHDHDEFPLPGIPQLVPELTRDFSLHIVSNLPHNSPLNTLTKYGLSGHFATTTFSYEAGFRKPRPEIYQLALQRAGCRPESGIFISHDQEEVDGAKRVGMQAYLATNADEIRGVLHENPVH